MIKTGFTALLLILLTGCANIKIDSYNPYTTRSDSAAPKNVMVFFDGTANDLESQTNVSDLYNLIKNQNRNDFATLYLDGVGTKKKVLGALTGWGIGMDVRDAYSYLGKHYQAGDDLYLVGFSRGSYAARILAGFIYVAGVIDTRQLDESERKKFVAELYSAYKNPPQTKITSRHEIVTIKRSLYERSKAVQSVLERWRRVSGLALSAVETNTRITAMALWDTVEALGVPDYKENVAYVNGNYLDQICNMDKAFHAVALDDNRARIYTPILMTYRGINHLCPETAVESVVDEVWFSGAHADLGGGYGEGYLAGVSLNWMIKNLQGVANKKLPIFTETPVVFFNQYDVVHDAQGANFFYKKAFKREFRKPKIYTEETSYNAQKLKVHCSVAARLSKQKTLVQKQWDAAIQLNPKLKSYDSKWQNAFEGCFDEQGEGYVFIPSCSTLTLVEDDAVCSVSK